MSKTRKPCPGCGETVYRDADKVCNLCQKILEKARDEEEFLKGQTDRVVIGYAERPYWNADIYTHSKKGDEIRDRFFDLVKAAAQPMLYYQTPEFYVLGKMSSYYPVCATMNRMAAEAIRDIYEMLNPILKAEYEAGKKDGHNLLMRLANGDLAPNAFMEKTNDE